MYSSFIYAASETLRLFVVSYATMNFKNEAYGLLSNVGIIGATIEYV